MSETTDLKRRFANALERLDGDFELLCEMAAVTLPDCPAVLQQIKEDFAADDESAVCSSLHKLKGMLSTYEDDGVVLEIQEMLSMARRGHLAEAESVFRQELPKIESLVADIQSLRESA